MKNRKSGVRVIKDGVTSFWEAEFDDLDRLVLGNTSHRSIWSHEEVLSCAFIRDFSQRGYTVFCCGNCVHFKKGGMADDTNDCGFCVEGRQSQPISAADLTTSYSTCEAHQPR